jgi:4-hydroxy-tetrahydrodipicolinate reductase
MSDPIRVIVWGPGGLGSVAIWEVCRLPEFELVGVRAYSEGKIGKDAGELIGINEVGITATDDVATLLALDADCVIFTPRDFGNFNTDEELLQILAGGKNVVTPLPYHNAHLYRDAEFVDKLNRACAAGKCTFHATGIDPDLISDRVVTALTGLCTDIKQIKLREMWDVDHVEALLLGIVGFGKSPAEAEGTGLAAGVSTNFLHAIGRTFEETLGVRYDRVEETHEYIPADHDVEIQHLKVPAGTVGRVVHSFRGWVDEIGSEPLFTMEYNWVTGPEMLPEGIEPGQYWVAEIEGTPSVKMVIDLRTSLAGGARFYDYGNLNSEPGYHGTIAPCLQSIPIVVAASAGVLPSIGPGLHWRPDLRDVASESTAGTPSAS